MKDIILKKLEKLEEEHSIKILYAIESGSRGWGFESTDSDYDVRFIYIHKPEWYLSIVEKRDVIELPINDLLDINGWDIKKALTLFRRTNPSMLEWLSSPILYKEYTDFAENLRTLSKNYFSSKSCIYHYLHMAEGNYREYLKGTTVRIKKYFYVLRPIMACMWVKKYGTQPPMLFEELMNSVELDSQLIEEINSLLERKRQGVELKEENRIDILNEFLEDKIKFFNEYVKTIEHNKGNVDELDKLFQNTLKEAWK